MTTLCQLFKEYGSKSNSYFEIISVIEEILIYWPKNSDMQK